MSKSQSEKEDGEIIDSEPGQIIMEQKSQRVLKPTKVFEMKSSNFKTKVCEHFKKGSCKNGTKCSFIHPVDVTLPICKFHLGGHCNKPKCDYSHDISNYQCKYYFGGGNCSKANCQFSHDSFKTDVSKNNWIKENFQYLIDIYKNKNHTALGDSFVQYLLVNHPEYLSKRPYSINSNQVHRQSRQQHQYLQDKLHQLPHLSQPLAHQNDSPEPQFSPIDEDSMPSYKSQVTQDDERYSQPLEFEPIESSEQLEQENSVIIEEMSEESLESQSLPDQPPEQHITTHKKQMEQKQIVKQSQIVHQQQSNIIQKNKKVDQFIDESEWNEKDFKYFERPSIIAFLSNKDKITRQT